MTPAQAIQAAQIARTITDLQATITQMQGLENSNMTLSSVTLFFNELAVPVQLANKLTQLQTQGLIQTGIGLLQDNLVLQQEALAAIQ